MKTRRYDGTDVRRVIAAMVTNRTVCARIASQWSRGRGLFSSAEDNLIGGWCVDYLRKYNRVPGEQIGSLFDEWACKSNDKATVELVRRRLETISTHFDKNGDESTDFLLDVAGKLFNLNRLRQLRDELEVDLDNYDLEEAQKRITALSRVELGAGSVIRPSEDVSFWEDAFDESQTRPLFTYPGALGRFFGNEFSRDSFVAVMASSKRGKSWWLLDMAYRAIRQRRRVLYFEAGDLSRRQIARRLGQRALQRPKRDGSYAIPVRYTDHEKPPECEMRELKAITETGCLRAWRALEKKRDRFRLCCFSNNSLTVDHANSLIQDWSREGWVPDVVIIDYADILAPPAGVQEGRDRINENWKQLRRMSQDFHCLVVTATQADAESYSKQVLTRKNFSDDRRKHDHVTAMFALNVTDNDKQAGISRLNWLDRRDEAYLESQQVFVAGCLAIGCPAMKSTI